MELALLLFPICTLPFGAIRFPFNATENSYFEKIARSLWVWFINAFIPTKACYHFETRLIQNANIRIQYLLQIP